MFGGSSRFSRRLLRLARHCPSATRGRIKCSANSRDWQHQQSECSKHPSLCQNIALLSSNASSGLIVPRASADRHRRDRNGHTSTSSGNSARRTNKRSRQTNQKRKEWYKNSVSKKKTIDFTNHLKKMVSSGDANDLQEAEQQLRYHLLSWSEDNNLARPNEYTFGVLLGAYSKARHIPESAVKAEDLFNLLVDTYESQEARSKDKNDSVWLMPSPFCTSAAISAWGKNAGMLLDKSMDPIKRASTILDRVEMLYQRYGRGEVKPNSDVYGALISVYAFVNNSSRGDGKQISVEQKMANNDRAEAILHKMEDQYSAGDKACRPNTRTFGEIIHCLAGSSSVSNPGAADRVDAILEHMERLYDKTQYLDMRPNFFCYTNAIHCWGRSERPEAVDKALNIIKHMEELSDSGANKEARPNAFAYCAAINTLARSGNVRGSKVSLRNVGEKTDEVLRRMQERGVPLDRAAANAAINAWSRSQHPRAVHRVEEIIGDMERSTYHRGKPDIATWNSLINCYTKSGDPLAPEKAERVLHEVEDSYLSGKYDRKPQVLTYSAVLQAWAKSERPDAAQKAEAIITNMSERKFGVQGRSLAMTPTSICYDALIETLARSNHEDALQKINDTLQYMNEQVSAGNLSMMPSTRTYQAAILACSKRADSENAGAAEKAESLLRRMIEFRQSGNNTVRPNAVVYSACISAYASLNSKHGAAKALELLHEMIIVFNETGDRGIRPNQITWSAVINAYAKSGEPGSAEKANGLLHKMIGLSSQPEYNNVVPNAVVFNSVIDAYSKANDIDPIIAATKSENILNEMRKISASGDENVRPDAFTYSTIINAHSRAGNGERAEELLREMCDLYEKGEESMKPNVVAFTSCIQAYANSSRWELAKVERLLDEMWNRSKDGETAVKPNAGTCSIVLKIYCNAFEGDGDHVADGLSKAETLLERMVTEYVAGDEALKPGIQILGIVSDAFVASADSEGVDRIDKLRERIQSQK